MLAALLLLGFSLLVDVADEIALLDVPGVRFLEDGAKFLGIAGWLCYFSYFALLEIRARTSKPAATPPGAERFHPAAGGNQ
jgi:hypothetical protein